jgi:homocysteine S-methyltransferase
VDRPLIVDGGLATALEARGHALHPRLWSAGVFLERPEVVEALHAEYLAAGAEILIGASYQMSFPGLEREGLHHDAAAAAMLRTVAAARRAGERAGTSPIVAASVGPYGATLADGSEYHGRYALDVPALADFHRERLELLATSEADLMAIETIPSFHEARALRLLLDEGRGIDAWVSFSCRDGACLRDGPPLVRAVALFEDCRRVMAIGVNCTAPSHVARLIDAIRSVSGKRIVVYPNSGELWDAARRRWSGRVAEERFLEQAVGWARQGVWAVGGCCRVGPETIRRLASRLRGRDGQSM